MSYSISGTIGVFCLFLALVTFWLPNPWWWISICFLLTAFFVAALRTTWKFSSWTHDNIVEKSDKK